MNSNRLSATGYAPGTGGVCATTTTTSSQSLSFDVADRMLATGAASGTAYDAWGRITALPAALTSTPGAGAASVGYYVNDLVASLTQGGVARSWVLDPAYRVASMTTTGAGSTALVNHYGDPGSDSPAWSKDTDAAGTVATRRYVTGFAGLLAEATTVTAGTTVTIELTGLHGDVAATTSPTATGSPTGGVAVDADEFGQVRDPDTVAITTGPRYGWLGGHQRATDTGTAGLTLMGVRLYAPAVGRFLSTDPVYGGNANTYTYPADPINAFDLDGRARRTSYSYCRLFMFLCRGGDEMPIIRHLSTENVKRSIRWTWRNRGDIAMGVSFAACAVVTVGQCLAIGVAVALIKFQQSKDGGAFAADAITAGWGAKVGWLIRAVRSSRATEKLTGFLYSAPSYVQCASNKFKGGMC